ncbi:hypothetical protein [Streptosporangium sp. LJ11]|uniref:hypothetical protein n=1 Tax=Streptosporangium sp. LJ11 TaxID=3436927 RepID=UPI003F795BC5
MRKEASRPKGAGKPANTEKKNKPTPGMIEEIRNKLESELSVKIRKEVRQELSRELRAAERSRIEMRVRAELNQHFKIEIETLRAELKSKLLDPAYLLSEFTKQTAKILEGHREGSTPSRQQISTTVRQAILEVLHTRKTHLSQLIELDKLLHVGATRKVIVGRVSNWMTQAGMRRIDTPENLEYFVLQGDDDGDEFVAVMSPAYVDALTGQIIQPGQVKFVTNNHQHSRGQKPVRRSDVQKNVTADQE